MLFAAAASLWRQLPRACSSSTSTSSPAALLQQRGRQLHAAVTCCAPPPPSSLPPPLHQPAGAPAKKSAPIPPVKRISRADVDIQFARSSGAGGQNVNKVNTKVDMRLHLDRADWLDEDIREAVRRAEKKRINKEGELVLQSQRTRSQADNVEDALAKLQEILDDAWKAVQPIEEDPAKQREMQKALERGNARRLQDKKLVGDKKKERRAKIEW